MSDPTRDAERSEVEKSDNGQKCFRFSADGWVGGMKGRRDIAGP